MASIKNGNENVVIKEVSSVPIVLTVLTVQNKICSANRAYPEPKQPGNEFVIFIFCWK